MRQKSGLVREPAEQVMKNIRRVTRRHFSAEEKIRVVLEGLRGEGSIAPRPPGARSKKLPNSMLTNSRTFNWTSTAKEAFMLTSLVA